MADLYLHLAFTRRLRLADGLHPIVSEALARRAGLAAFGAALAQLPQHERQSLGFFRRLFGGGSDAARWQKLLAPTPGQARVDLIAAVLAPSFEKTEKAEGETRRDTAEGAPGSMQRLALALGVLAHDLLEIALAPTTAQTPQNDRAAVERAQARLWLQAAVPNASDLEREWRVVADLAETDSFKPAIGHLDRAFHRAFKTAPGEATIARWMKRLAADVAPVADVARSQGLPPSLHVADATARGPSFDDAGVVEKVQGAVTRFVLIANRIAEQILDDAPPERVLAQLTVALGASADVATATSELESARTRWREWLARTRDSALTRGRNPKPAYEESTAPGEERIAGEPPELPPEAAAAIGAPPLPEMSGPNIPPPTMTQEVSVAQIEAEAAAAQHEMQSPPHTQEISAVQIESAQDATGEAGAFEAPPHTQEVSVAQIEELRPTPSASTTQPISAEDILLARTAEPTSAADDASKGNGEATAAPPGDGAPAAGTPAATDSAAATPTHTGGADAAADRPRE